MYNSWSIQQLSSVTCFAQVIAVLPTQYHHKEPSHSTQQHNKNKNTQTTNIILSGMITKEIHPYYIDITFSVFRISDLISLTETELDIIYSTMASF
jgi:hypothetical protein